MLLLLAHSLSGSSQNRDTPKGCPTKCWVRPADAGNESPADAGNESPTDAGNERLTRSIQKHVANAFPASLRCYVRPDAAVKSQPEACDLRPNISPGIKMSRSKLTKTRTLLSPRSGHVVACQSEVLVGPETRLLLTRSNAHRRTITGVGFSSYQLVNLSVDATVERTFDDCG